jgi:hypothetical protein
MFIGDEAVARANEFLGEMTKAFAEPTDANTAAALRTTVPVFMMIISVNKRRQMQQQQHRRSQREL